MCTGRPAGESGALTLNCKPVIPNHSNFKTENQKNPTTPGSDVKGITSERTAWFHSHVYTHFLILGSKRVFCCLQNLLSSSILCGIDVSCSCCHYVANISPPDALSLLGARFILTLMQCSPSCGSLCTFTLAAYFFLHTCLAGYSTLCTQCEHACCFTHQFPGSFIHAGCFYLQFASTRIVIFICLLLKFTSWCFA